MRERKESGTIFIMLFFLFIVCLVYTAVFFPKYRYPPFPEGHINTNQDFIEGLYTSLDLNDTISVFRYVFTRLDDEVTVYPTENYFYYNFVAEGVHFRGTFTLFADNRDEGVFGFSYIEYDPDPSVPDEEPRIGGSKHFKAEDGVIVKKIHDFLYSVTFEGKTIKFYLNNVGLNPPQQAQLLPEETYVGTIFDESGLKFFLIFNNETQRLYHILDEDAFVPEQWRVLNEGVLIGKRTDFAFYNDSINKRKILVGTKGENVLKNNWYDGPFDQMPDNYVYTGQIETQPFLEAHYKVEGQIDKYGNYIQKEGSRVAVAPYNVYFSDQNLGFVQYCKGLNLTQSVFYTCITEQVYEIPHERANW